MGQINAAAGRDWIFKVKVAILQRCFFNAVIHSSRINFNSRFRTIRTADKLSGDSVKF